MNILAITDIHGHKEFFNSLELIISEKDIDCIIICGDITNFGTKEDARESLMTFKDFNMPLFVIPGNCDRREILDQRHPVWRHTQSANCNGGASGGRLRGS